MYHQYRMCIRTLNSTYLRDQELNVKCVINNIYYSCDKNDICIGNIKFYVLNQSKYFINSVNVYYICLIS